MLDDLVGLDFETYGAVDLKVHGLMRYSTDKTFRPLIVSPSYYDDFGVKHKYTIDLVLTDYDQGREMLERQLEGRKIVAHNAPFEQAVLRHMGIDASSKRFIDSAVVARAAGAAGKLEAAAPQLTQHDKLDEGQRLIKLFCMPSKERRELGELEFNDDVVRANLADWALFAQYCEIDSEAGLDIVAHWLRVLTDNELSYQEITMEMNRVGWRVDIDTVEEMQRRYIENQEQAEFDFRQNTRSLDLNLNSLKQLKEWTAARGIKASSFAEKPLASLGKRIEKKLGTMSVDDPKYLGYREVLDLVKVKQTLGGASLKKLQVILNTVVLDDDGQYRLKDQYMHIGAGQSYRTTGRSVQMQNLKRLDSENVGDMAELEDEESVWDNGKLAENLRQVFTSSDQDGRLIVGDFASVESRGLAWAAGAKWKLDGFRAGKDMYKVQAAKIFHIHYDDVIKPQRQTGKVGELSCGYGAGGGAVQSFAAGMGIEMNEAEAATLVKDWRFANPEVVAFWERLNEMLHRVVELGSAESHPLPDGFVLEIRPSTTPDSLRKQHPEAKSICMEVLDPRGNVFLRRFFHGCYVRGGNIGYYKPSERKTGDLWKNHFKDQKTKEVRFYELYGGKLTGIFIQSFCRELFFQCLKGVHGWVAGNRGLSLVGQFHDEIVVDWTPGSNLTLDEAKQQMGTFMSNPGWATSFPLEADIKDDYRYTK